MVAGWMDGTTTRKKERISLRRQEKKESDDLNDR